MARKRREYSNSNGNGISNCNVVNAVVSFANVTAADQSDALANSAAFVAGDDIYAEQDNDNQVQDHD